MNGNYACKEVDVKHACVTQVVTQVQKFSKVARKYLLFITFLFIKREKRDVLMVRA